MTALVRASSSLVWRRETAACRRARRVPPYTLGYEMFDDHPVDEVAAQAARRAITKLEARPAPSGVLPVVLERGSGGFLFHEACGHGLEADHILKDSSVYIGRVGEMVASPGVTLVDDGTFGPKLGHASD